MTSFNTISEKAILYYAHGAIWERISKEQEHLKKYPDNLIAPARIKKYMAQANELNDRIIEIERTEQTA